MDCDCGNATTQEMIVGEDRWLSYMVVSCSTGPEEYSIQEATYEIPGFGADGGDASGNCVVNNVDKIVKVKVRPVKTGVFTLTFTLLIADETIKLRARLNVCE